MATDRTEQNRRGQSPAKTTTKHPYAAIEHRVIDSPAFADLTFSAKTLLLMMARQLTKDNNGHLQATFSYMRRYGFSENTLSRAIADLISHGMIYRTRSGGYQQGAAQYAVTWLAVKNRQGLFLDGFKPCAWRDWQPGSTEEKKTPPPKLRETHLKNGEWTMLTPPKSEAGTPPKNEDNELMPCSAVNSAQQARRNRPRKQLTSPFTIRLIRNADRGCFRRRSGSVTPAVAVLESGLDQLSGSTIADHAESVDESWQRVRDNEPGQVWCEETGEFVTLPVKRIGRDRQAAIAEASRLAAKLVPKRHKDARVRFC